MSVEVLNESGVDLDLGQFTTLSRFVIRRMRVHPQAVLCLKLVDEPTMADYNQRFMGKTCAPCGERGFAQRFWGDAGMHPIGTWRDALSFERRGNRSLGIAANHAICETSACLAEGDENASVVRRR